MELSPANQNAIWATGKQAELVGFALCSLEFFTNRSEFWLS